MSNEGYATRPYYEPAELVAQGGLADAGLTDKHDQCAETPRRGFKCCLELGQLTLSAYEWTPPGCLNLPQRLQSGVQRWEACARRHELCRSL
jgi:hypothetical protein